MNFAKARESSGKMEEKMEEEVVEENPGEEAMDTKPSPIIEATPGQYDRSQLPDLLRVYYTWLFPFDKYFDWLQYGKRSAPSNPWTSEQL